jgi:O-antigen ligase
MGILAGIKSLAPLSLYAIGIIAFFMAIAGRIQWALILVTLLLPLRNVVDKLQDFPGGTNFLDMLFFAMILGWFISSSDRKPLMDRSAINAAAICLILYTTLSLLIGSMYLTGSPMIDVSDSRVQDWKNFCLLPVLFFLTLNNIQDKLWVQRMFWVMCFSILLMSYYTSTQISFFSSLESRAKITGTFQFLGPNEVAAFLNQCTIVLLGVFFFMKRSRNKLILLGIILLNIYCITFVYSRAAYLGLAAGLFILFAVKKKVLLIPLILAGLLWQVILPEKAVERIKETKNEYGELDESSARRIDMWNVGLQLFAENPVTGIGYGVFRHLGLDLRDTHNIYVKLMVEQGTLGLLIFFIVVLCFMREGFQLYQKGDDDFSRGLGLGLFACMFTLLINNMFGDRWAYFELSAYFWIFAGLVSRLSNISRTAKTAPAAASQPAETEIKRKPKSSYYK